MMKYAIAVVVGIAPRPVRGEDLIDALYYGLSVDGGDMVDIDAPYFLVGGQFHDEIAGLEGSLLGNVEPEGRCRVVSLRRGREYAVVLIKQCDGAVRPARGGVVGAKANGSAQDGQRPQQGEHGDEDEPPAQRADHEISSSRYPCPRRATMRTLAPRDSSFRRR